MMERKYCERYGGGFVHKAGRVYWITGLKYSGKTTIGTALYYSLREKNQNVIILDGDILKEFVGDAFGYTKQERYERATRYSKLCKLLTEQGLIVVICTISMFHEIRKWNRKNIKGYIEVYVDTPMEIIKERDRNGKYYDEEIKNIIKDMEFPVAPDITLHNDGTQSVSVMVQNIMRITPQEEDDFARDQVYWNQYYGKKREEIKTPSNFAISIVKDLIPGKQLLELGCGDGRDSLYFLAHGLYVTGIDASDEAIKRLRSEGNYFDRGMFICDDFVKCRAVQQRQYDYIYSRFTLHAISNEQEDELLRNIKNAMPKGSKLFIETRTIHDDIYGKGDKVALNSYIYEGHFRRFIDPSILEKKLTDFGYTILSMREERGFSPTKESDPMLLRAVANV